MCYEHYGSTRHVARGFEHIQNLRLHGYIECGRWLVGQNHLGLVGNRQRDHYSLTHATRKLVRVRLRAFGWPWNADNLEQFDCSGKCSFLRDVTMNMDCLANLPANGVHGVERRERVLKHHRNVFAAILRHLVVVEIKQVDTVIGDRTGDGGAFGNQTNH